MTNNNTTVKKPEVKEIKKEKIDVQGLKDIKIVGVARNYNNDGKDYFIGYDGKKFFLFTGRLTTLPSEDPALNYDVFEHMWDEYL